MNNGNNMNVCYEAINLWYDREYLRDHMLSIPLHNWYVFDCGFIRWTVHESFTPRSECKNYPQSEFHKELFQLFDPPILPDTMLYTRTPVGGTPPHQDRNRKCVLNFAVDGLFGNHSPQTFHTDFDSSKKLFDMPYRKSEKTKEFAPWFFKGQSIHGVDNWDDPERTILTVCWRHNDYEDILEKLFNGSLINWDINEKNKRIKFL